jgi:hypothetical protein
VAPSVPRIKAFFGQVSFRDTRPANPALGVAGKDGGRRCAFPPYDFWGLCLDLNMLPSLGCRFWWLFRLHEFWRLRPMKTKFLLLGAALLAIPLVTATAAKADPWDHGGGGWNNGWHGDHDDHWRGGGGWGGGWHGGGGWGGGYYPPPPPYYPPPRVYYAPPPPVYYAPPPPPPVYYAPPPVYYGPPSVSFGFSIP